MIDRILRHYNRRFLNYWSYNSESAVGVHSFFIRTSKFCLRLAVLFFFFHFWEAEMFLTCSYFPEWTSQCHKEECQTEYNKNTISFLSFFFFQAVQIGSQWEVFYKKSGSATVLNPIKRYLQRSSIFHWSFTLQVCKSTKVELLHRYFP